MLLNILKSDISVKYHMYDEKTGGHTRSCDNMVYNVARRLLGNHGVHYSRQRVSKENGETFCGSVNGVFAAAQILIWKILQSTSPFSAREYFLIKKSISLMFDIR